LFVRGAIPKHDGCWWKWMVVRATLPDMAVEISPHPPPPPLLCSAADRLLLIICGDALPASSVEMEPLEHRIFSEIKRHPVHEGLGYLRYVLNIAARRDRAGFVAVLVWDHKAYPRAAAGRA